MKVTVYTLTVAGEDVRTSVFGTEAEMHADLRECIENELADCMLTIYDQARADEMSAVDLWEWWHDTYDTGETRYFWGPHDVEVTQDA